MSFQYNTGLWQTDRHTTTANTVLAQLRAVKLQYQVERLNDAATCPRLSEHSAQWTCSSTVKIRPINDRCFASCFCDNLRTNFLLNRKPHSAISCKWNYERWLTRPSRFSPGFDSCQSYGIQINAVQRKDLFTIKKMKNLSEQYRVQAGAALMSFRGAPAASCAVHLLPEYILPLSAVGTSVARPPSDRKHIALLPLQ